MAHIESHNEELLVDVIHQHEHDDHEHHEHHKESFISKYIFSQDHKMISRQFLITGILWAVIGLAFSVMFRLQLGLARPKFPYLRNIFGWLGKRW
jgi:cytochrome c oxidase subunit 1